MFILKNYAYNDFGNQTLIKTINNESKTPGIWNVEYNGENRPIKWTNNATNESIVMYYDYRGRRCGKLFYNSDGIWQSSVKFFYNNFTLIQESTASNIITKEFVWDPSEPVATRPLAMKCNVQNLNLLYTHDANKNVTEVLYLATINGLAAHYEYSPFGELRDFSHLSTNPETSNSETAAITETSNSEVNAITETSNSEVNAITETSNPGSQLMWNEVLSHALNLETNAITETSNSETNAIAETSNSEVNAIVETSNSSNNASPGDLIGWSDTPITEIDIRSFNPFRFSSEYHDDELSLIYYNYRHYDPTTGRWLSREPLEEYGSVNLYAMCFNDVINFFDWLGLMEDERTFPLITFPFGGGGSFKVANSNYGGPGYTGGVFNKEGDLPPKDEEDKCYKKHDNCYKDCKTECNSLKESKCKRKCDERLVKCLLTQFDVKSVLSPTRYIAAGVFIVIPIGRRIAEIFY